jgi:YesN/AraC family two-component response regulator
VTASDASAEKDMLTVLFVDDEPAIVRAIARVIPARAGFDVRTATSAKEALAILRAGHVDVLVSDIDMPEMGGLELVHLARREFPSTLRILLTGAGTMERAVSAINEGEVVRFFAKPFNVDTFVHALDDLRARILMLRRERYAEAQRERCEELFRWIEGRYPGALAFERGAGGEVVIDDGRVRAYLGSAPPEVRALLGSR